MEPKQTQLEGFKEALRDVEVIVAKTSPHFANFAELAEACADVIAIAGRAAAYFQSFDEFVSACQLAQENDGQARLLMALVQPKK